MHTLTATDKQIISARGVVYPWQCDHMGHMNVMWYTGKFDEATWHLFGYIGVTPSYLRDQARHGWPAAGYVLQTRAFCRRPRYYQVRNSGNAAKGDPHVS